MRKVDLILVGLVIGYIAASLFTDFGYSGHCYTYPVFDWLAGVRAPTPCR